MISFKVGVKTAVGRDWEFNSLRFATIEEAENYARAMFHRWTEIKEWTVQETDEPVNTYYDA